MLRGEKVSAENLKAITEQVTQFLCERAEEGLLEQAGLAGRAAGAGDSAPAKGYGPRAESARRGKKAQAGDATNGRPSFALAEAFAIYKLGPKKLAVGRDGGAPDIASLADPADRLHHQLTVNGKAVGYVTSTITPKVSVSQLFVSNLAASIDEAVTWLDRYEDEHPEFAEQDIVVRLLVVPAFDVYAFMLVRGPGAGTEVVVIDAPADVKLERRRFYSSQEFLQAFEGATPAAGLT